MKIIQKKKRHFRDASLGFKSTRRLVFALLGECVGCTKADEHGDAAAYRGRLVAGFTVARETDTIAVVQHGGVAALFSCGLALAEQTAAFCIRSHAQSEDDGECQC